MITTADIPSAQAEVSDAVRELAFAAAAEAAGGAAQLEPHLQAHWEDEVALTVSFATTDPGYAGWRWSVTVAEIPGCAPTVSEVVLLPSAAALLAPPWVPWDERVRHGDLGPGDLLPPPADDERIVPAYLASDDPAVEDVAHELGIGRMRVLSRRGRSKAARRWRRGDFGPSAEMAVKAPAHCGTCAFYLPLAGSLGAGFGGCANDLSPADGRVVEAGYGCGGHSETHLDDGGPAAERALDELDLELHARPVTDVFRSPSAVAAVWAAGHVLTAPAI